MSVAETDCQWHTQTFCLRSSVSPQCQPCRAWSQLLSAVVSCYQLMSAVVSCCQLFSAVVSWCQLLSADVSCCQLGSAVVRWSSYKTSHPSVSHIPAHMLHLTLSPSHSITLHPPLNSRNQPPGRRVGGNRTFVRKNWTFGVRMSKSQGM